MGPTGNINARLLRSVSASVGFVINLLYDIIISIASQASYELGPPGI